MKRIVTRIKVTTIVRVDILLKKLLKWKRTNNQISKRGCWKEGDSVVDDEKVKVGQKEVDFNTKPSSRKQVGYSENEVGHEKNK